MISVTFYGWLYFCWYGFKVLVCSAVYMMSWYWGKAQKDSISHHTFNLLVFCSQSASHHTFYLLFVSIAYFFQFLVMASGYHLYCLASQFDIEEQKIRYITQTIKKRLRLDNMYELPVHSYKKKQSCVSHEYQKINFMRFTC